MTDPDTAGGPRPMRGRRALVSLGLFAVFAFGVHRFPAHWFVAKRNAEPSDLSPRDLVVAGVPNVHRLSPRILTGAQPEDDGGFRALAALGVRTVVSVDGPTPNVPAARRAGLRYVHLPVLYSGVTRKRALEIARVVRELPGPVFIHCHRGTQRAPTAGALAAMAVDGVSKDEALASMKHAGTSEHYAGLYGCVREFEPVTTAELDGASAAFPETQPPLPFLEVMGELDSGIERLKTGRVREDAAHEALLLRESLFELTRSNTKTARERDPEFQRSLQSAVEAATELESRLRGGNSSARAIERLEGKCTACHERFRDPP